MCTGKSLEEWAESSDLDWYGEYADGSDAGKGVLTADWNHFPRFEAGTWPRTPESEAAQEFNWNRGRKFQDILEKMGYHLEWSDQTSRCEHCNGAITEGPDYYGDSAHYVVLGECDIVCARCIAEDFAQEYLEGLEDNPREAVNVRGVDPAAYGYTLISEPGQYENGMHPGQTDNLVAILKALHAQGKTGIVFRISDIGQFDVTFETWQKQAEEEEEEDTSGDL